MIIQKSVHHPISTPIIANFEIRNSGQGNLSNKETPDNVSQNPEAAAQIALDGNIISNQVA